MFDNEYAVEITLPSQEKVSLFADKTLVQFIGSEAFLTVNLIEDDQNEEETPILLPSESFEKGSRWLRIPRSQLAPA